MIMHFTYIYKYLSHKTGSFELLQWLLINKLLMQGGRNTGIA